MARVTVDIASDSNNNALHDTMVVHKHYDPEGNLDYDSTLSAPDRNSIGWVIHQFVYDQANRQVLEVLVGKSSIPFVYDPVGNLINGGRQGGNAVTVSYDALNRPIQPGGGRGATFIYDARGQLLNANNPYCGVSRS